MTLIVATLGPGTATADDWRAVLLAGADVLRFTASKSSVEDLAAQAIQVRATAASMSLDPELVLDLPGSKPRLANTELLDLGAVSTLDLLRDPAPQGASPGGPRIGVTGLGPSARLERGDVLLVGDGEDALEVVEVLTDGWRVRPLTTGTMGPRRGLAWPNESVRNESLTERDLAALRLLPSSPFDAAVISFVESAETMMTARRALGPVVEGTPRRLVAKIESRAGILALDAVAEASDAILIGRGDLLLDSGVLDLHQLVDGVLARIGELPCPVVVGTQLLTSLQDGWLPHRSELSFVCDAMSRGVSGLMLAEETAASREPARAVELLDALRGRYSTASRAPLLGRVERSW
ncbi:pyruvate kinase [Aeromicrobium sp. Root495]|uniref:pyruvate kinase n=1 Tax=Aeromicrobium sp. Root495 TaxID=1736550 RepID=UPI0009EA27F0|nr:pyruvate kinase [Aeromicrobium sp. Root495]